MKLFTSYIVEKFKIDKNIKSDTTLKKGDYCLILSFNENTFSGPSGVTVDIYPPMYITDISDKEISYITNKLTDKESRNINLNITKNRAGYYQYKHGAKTAVFLPIDYIDEVIDDIFPKFDKTKEWDKDNNLAEIPHEDINIKNITHYMPDINVNNAEASKTHSYAILYEIYKIYKNLLNDKS